MTYTIIALTIICFVLKLVDHEQCEAGIMSYLLIPHGSLDKQKLLNNIYQIKIDEIKLNLTGLYCTALYYSALRSDNEE